MGQVCAALPSDWQSIVFVDHVADHMREVYKFMPAGSKYIHRNASKKQVGSFALSPKEQKQVMQDFKDNKFRHLLSSDLGRAGLDVVNVRCVVQGSGGCSVVELTQEAGRGSRIIPEARRLELGVSPKTHFVLIDFKDNHDDVLANMSNARRKIYTQLGWTIKDVKSVDEIDFLWDGS
jgi:superfamily II DNA or RNA helicase